MVSSFASRLEGVDMITHNAEGVELKPELFYRFLEGIEQYLTAFEAG